MAEFGSVITEVGVDLSRLDRDLVEARKRLRQFYDDAAKMAVAIHAGGGGAIPVGGGGRGGGRAGMGGRGPGYDVAGVQLNPLEIQRVIRNPEEDEARRYFAMRARADTEHERRFRTIESARLQAESQQRRMSAAQAAAEKEFELEQRRMSVAQAAAEKENAAREQAALKAEYAEIKRIDDARIADEKTIANFRKAEYEAIKRNDQARLADEKTIANFEKAAFDQRMGELRAKNVLIQATTKEELAASEATQRARADAVKEAQQFRTQLNQEYLARGRQADKERTEELKRSADAAKRLSEHVQNFKQGLEDALGWAKQLAPFLGAGIASGLGAAAVEAFNLNRELQLQRLTLAADLELTTKIVDAHGHYVGLQKELQINLAQTPVMLRQIRQEAEKTTLTEQELRTVVSRNLAPALRAGRGSTPTTAIDMISQLANAARVFGAGNENQVSSEVRGILNASPLVRRSILGGALGISPKQLKDAQEAGTLFALLQKRLQLIQPLLDQANLTFDHLFSTLISKGKDFLQLALQDVFQKITGKVMDLNQAFSDEKVEAMAHQFSDTLDRWYERLEAIGQSSGFKAIQKFFSFLVEHYTSIIAVFAAWKLAQASAGAYSTLSGISSAAGILAKRGAGAAAAGEGAAAAIPFAGAFTAAIPTFMAAIGGLAGLAAAVVPVALAAAATYTLAQGVVAPFMRELGQRFSGATPNTGLIPRLARHPRGLIGPPAPYSTYQRELLAIETRASAAQGRAQRIFQREGAYAGEDSAFKEAQKQYELALQDEKQLRAEITKTNAERAKPEVLHRIARSYGDEEEKKKKKAIDLDAWVKRLLAKGTEDEKEQLRMRYEADARSVYDKIANRKRANEIVRELHQQLVDKEADIDEKNAEAQRKFLADMKNDKLAALKEEYQEHLDTIKSMTLTDAQDQQDRLAALRAYLQARADQIREWTTKERDLAQEAITDKADLHKKEVAMVRELADLKESAARRSRDLAQQDADAQRDLARAQIDRKQAEERLFGTPGRHIAAQMFGPNASQGDIAAALRMGITPGLQGLVIPGQDIAGTPGFEDEREAIRQAARRLFSGNVPGLLQQNLLARNPQLTPQLAQAQVQAQVRQMIETLQGQGGAAQVQQQLQAAGIGFATPQAQSFLGQLQGLEARSLTLQGRESAAQEQADIERTRREKEDADRTVQDAKRRVADVHDEETRAIRDYQTGLKRIQDNYKQQIIDTTSVFVKLGEEVRKLTRELAASGMNIAPQFRATLAPYQHMTQVQAQRLTTQALAPVYHLTFGPGALQVKDLSAAELKRAVTELLQREARNAAPARR